MSDLLTMQTIARLVPVGSRVLDLGCGDGALLAHLQQTRGCTGYGIEIADANVLACVKRGVNVIQLNLDEGLSLFDDASFADRYLAALAQCRGDVARDSARGAHRDRGVSQFCALAEPAQCIERPHAGHPPPALPVV